MVEHATTGELVKIAADGGGQADGGGDAGKENNQSQNHLAGEAHIVHANHIQQLTTIGNNAKKGSAGGTGIGQSTINQRQANCCDNARINAHLSELLLLGHALGLNGL